MQEIVKSEKTKILRYTPKVPEQEIEKGNGIETLPLNPKDPCSYGKSGTRASKALLTVSLWSFRA